MVTILAGTAILSWLLRDPSFPLFSLVFEVVSAIGCVGLSAGVTSADLDTGSKVLLSLLMWVGRIELLPVFVLIASLLPVHWQRRVASDQEPDTD